MAHDDSLDAALAECGREPIHVPGGVQPFGALVAFDLATQRVTHASASCLGVLQRGPAGLVGRPLADVVNAAVVRDVLAASPAGVVNDLADVLPGATGPLIPLAHHFAGVGVLEFAEAERRPDRPGEDATLAAVHELAMGVAHAGSVEAYAGRVADHVRRLTGYDRALVYRFSPTWDGEVLAEAARDGRPRYAGLWFPAGDIPPQARTLYEDVRLRLLVDAQADPVPLLPGDGPPLDLRHAVLRAMSPVHREYLRNMGVRATLVLSLVVRGRLWGLIACHHDTPRRLHGRTRRKALLLAELVAGHLGTEELLARDRGVAWAQRLLGDLQAAPGDGDWAARLAGQADGLTRALDADGLAVCRDGAVVHAGRTPDRDGVARVVAWLETACAGPLYATDALPAAAPALADLAADGCGVLALRVPHQPGGWLVWFRGEQVRHVRWGGDPTKQLVERDGPPRLVPRASFAAWRQAVAGTARPWSAAERTLAGEAVRASLLDVIVAWQQETGERARADSEARYRLLADSISDVISLHDGVTARVLSVSPSAARLSGYTAEECAATDSWFWPHPEDEPLLRREFARNRAGVETTTEWRARRKDGSYVWIETTARPVFDAAGAVVQVACCTRDISARKQIEEQYRQLQKLEAVGRLAGGVAHDFNNLLTVITGYAELCAGAVPADWPFRPMLVEVLKAGERGAALTKQLLAYSRKQQLKLAPLDAHAVVRDLEPMLRRLIGEDVLLRVALAPRPAVVRADRGQFEQVLMNLAVNARDAMPAGGELLIASDLAADPPELRLRVRDSGVGMSAAVRDRLFEPFFTTKEPGHGTGLGLATVYGIVRQFGGDIAAESAPGAGTTFHIWLPLVPPAAAGPAAAPPPAATGGREAVLVVEDEPSVRDLVAIILRAAGYRVAVAEDAASADRLLAAGVACDLLLCDVVMPGGSGLDFAARLRGERPGVRVLHMSGYSEPRDRPPGSPRILPKPFTPDVLLAAVRAAIDAAGGATRGDP